MTESKSYLTVKQLPAIYPAFTESALRWAIFNRERNGFAQCVRKVGKKVLIDQERFEQWIEAGTM